MFKGKTNKAYTFNVSEIKKRKEKQERKETPIAFWNFYCVGIFETYFSIFICGIYISKQNYA